MIIHLGLDGENNCLPYARYRRLVDLKVVLEDTPTPVEFYGITWLVPFFPLLP